MLYVVQICVGLFCTNFVDTKFEYRSLTACIAKGYQLRYMTGYPPYVRTACRLKHGPNDKINVHGAE